MTFGWHSIVLLIGMVQGLVFAGLLLTRRNNRGANRLLALLLLLFVVTLTPSTIGFAGAYSAHPWLLFAPLTVTLGFGPALWLYVHGLSRGRLPRLWPLHLLPLGIQLSYYSVLFAQPLEWRKQYNGSVHNPIVNPAETLVALLSAGLYWAAAGRLYLAYRRWAPAHVSDSENYRLEWLRNFLVGSVVGFAVWMGFEVVDETIRPLSYRTFFWLDLLAAVLVYGFAVGGYRHADLAWKGMSEQADGTPVPDQGSRLADADSEPSAHAKPDWPEVLAGFRERLEAERWYLDPDLTLEGLARKLLTNSWTLSRAINEGAGCNFNDFVNGFRVEAVKKRLEQPGDSRTLLQTALECGFNSKTSFNRSFKKLTGETPTQYKAGLSPRTTS